MGDYVLTGGELPALLVIDAVTRLLPGALGDAMGRKTTRTPWDCLNIPTTLDPPDFRGWRVSEVLMSGDHARIAAWRRAQALQRTWMRRPDMIDEDRLSESERKMLRQWKQEAAQARSASDETVDPEIRE